MTLDQFVTATAGFPHLAVRIALVRAIADLRLGTRDRPSMRNADYRRLYRAVLDVLPSGTSYTGDPGARVPRADLLEVKSDGH